MFFSLRAQHDEQLITLVHAPKKDRCEEEDQILEIDVFGQRVFYDIFMISEGEIVY